MSAIVITLYVTSLVLSYLQTGSLCLLTTFLHFPLPQPSASGNYKSDVFFYEFGFFYIHSPTDGHLGCVHVLDTVNNAAVKWGYRYLFKLVFSFPLDMFPEVELLDHMVVLFLIFWGSSILFSIVAAPIYNPTTLHYYNLAHPVPFELHFESWPITTISLSQSVQPVSWTWDCCFKILFWVLIMLKLWKCKFSAGSLFSLCLFPQWSYLFLWF